MITKAHILLCVDCQHAKTSHHSGYGRCLVKGCYCSSFYNPITLADHYKMHVFLFSSMITLMGIALILIGGDYGDPGVKLLIAGIFLLACCFIGLLLHLNKKSDQ